MLRRARSTSPSYLPETSSRNTRMKTVSCCRRFLRGWVLMMWIPFTGGAPGTGECAAHRRHDVAHAVRAAWNCNMLPLGGKPGSFRGINSEVGARAPKRSWYNGSVSNSLARHTQHEFMWSFVTKYRPQLSHHTRRAPYITLPPTILGTPAGTTTNVAHQVS